MTTDTERAIATDIELCEIGMALTRGRLRQRYARHRAECFEAIREMNRADGLDRMSDDELMAALTAPNT